MYIFCFICTRFTEISDFILFARVRGKSNIWVSVNTNELRDEVKKNSDAAASGNIIISNMKATLTELINRGAPRIDFFNDFVLTLT